MLSIRFVSALAAAASLLPMASAQSSSSASKVVSISEPTTTLPANAMQTIGCFATGVPLEDHGAGPFASPGKCQLICLQLGKNILGLSDGTNCWCGDMVPPKSTQTDNSTCSTGCSGDKTSNCGGRNKLWVMTTGKDLNPFEFAPENILSKSSSSSSSATSAPTSQASQAVSPTASAEPEKKSNTVGIAVGVVVGVVVLCAIIGGVFFWLRQKRRREVEEEYRRQAAANQFVSGGKLHTSNSSMTDSRLDPEFMNRRQSNGSIADNEDYSRRILKVTNA